MCASLGFLPHGSGTRWKQEDVGVPSSGEDRGHVSPSTQPTAVPSNKMNLNFYKESEEANITGTGTGSFCQQAAATPPRSSLIRTSATDIQDTDSGSENEEEYLTPVIVRQYAQAKASAMVDEDYDT